MCERPNYTTTMFGETLLCGLMFYVYYKHLVHKLAKFSQKEFWVSTTKSDVFDYLKSCFIQFQFLVSVCTL